MNRKIKLVNNGGLKFRAPVLFQVLYKAMLLNLEN